MSAPVDLTHEERTVLSRALRSYRLALREYQACEREWGYAEPTSSTLALELVQDLLGKIEP